MHFFFFFFSGLDLRFFLRIRLKYIQTKYSKVYLKSTHLELLYIELTSKSLDSLCVTPSISFTSPTPSYPFPVVNRFRKMFCKLRV